MTNFLVDSDKKLSILSSKLHDITEIGLDTEFIRESTYRPILALIQISLPNGEIYLIDPQSINRRELIVDIINNNNLLKIIHSSKQDIEALYSYTETYPLNIFDTQIASNFLYEKSNVGYSSLVKTICNCDIKEGSWRTNWLERPLSDKKLNYAADDVKYLIYIKKFLMRELEKLDRVSWFNEEQEHELKKSNIILNAADAWEKINYPLYFSDYDLKMLKDIAYWREELAIKYNIPKRWILSDSLVIKVMMANPKKTNDILANIKQSISDSEIGAIKNILKNKAQSKNKNISPNKNLENKFTEILNSVSDEFKIDSTIIANKRDLEFFSHFHDKARFMKGWRYKIFGKLVQ